MVDTMARRLRKEGITLPHRRKADMRRLRPTGSPSITIRRHKVQDILFRASSSCNQRRSSNSSISSTHSSISSNTALPCRHIKLMSARRLMANSNTAVRVPVAGAIPARRDRQCSAGHRR